MLYDHWRMGGSRGRCDGCGCGCGDLRRGGGRGFGWGGLGGGEVG